MSSSSRLFRESIDWNETKSKESTPLFCHFYLLRSMLASGVAGVVLYALFKSLRPDLQGVHGLG
jgi:hypothetical protein